MTDLSSSGLRRGRDLTPHGDVEALESAGLVKLMVTGERLPSVSDAFITLASLVFIPSGVRLPSGRKVGWC